MKLANQFMAIFINFSPTLSHLHPLQVENCDSNSRLVVDEDDNVKSGLKELNHQHVQICGLKLKQLLGMTSIFVFTFVME